VIALFGAFLAVKSLRLTILLVLHLFVLAAFVYCAAITVKYYKHKPGKHGMTGLEIREILLCPKELISAVRRRGKKLPPELRPDCTQFAYRRPIIMPKHAPWVGLGLVAITICMTVAALMMVKGALNYSVELVVYLLFVGAAIQFMRLEVWKYGLTLGGIGTVFVWPKYIRFRRKRKEDEVDRANTA
jgi:hypothetical protein